ncbi:FAD-dependent monooxygenase [Streptomyces sp. NPDC087263]|uniref:FAD-dependent monooxygenase n=1 Tax=Streptomyces sp. NPDC087263 TaxID=3365773 RepID=UPI0037F6331B
MNEPILISGAGIAGQTLAHWLARHGFRATLVERAPRLRTGGQGVDVRDQAIEVAERMGILPGLRALAADIHGMRFVDGAGESLASIDLGGIKNKPTSVDLEGARNTYGNGEIEIMRGDLVEILHAETENEVEYLFGDSIRTLEQTDDGVTAAFERGPTRRFGLVVGADGLHSTVRRLAFGPESAFLRYQNHYAAFGNADSALGEDRWITVHNTPGRMTGIYRSGNHAQAKAYFMFRRRRPPAYDYRDVDQHKRLLRAEFAGESSWCVPELLAGALADPDLYFDTLSQVRMPSWSTGRVVLVGDAAHCASPVSGAGAELALVGAYRLAGELAAADGDHRLAFRRYEESHRELVGRKQQIGPNIRLIVPRSPIGIRTRNAVTRLPLQKSMAGMERILRPKNTTPLTDYDPQHRGRTP